MEDHPSSHVTTQWRKQQNAITQVHPTQEDRPISCSFNLVSAIRKRRLKWLGDILRTGPERITYQAVKEQRRLGLTGNLMMDTPSHVTLEELAANDKDRVLWKKLIDLIP